LTRRKRKFVEKVRVLSTKFSELEASADESSAYASALVEARSENPDIPRVLALLESALAEGDPRAAYALGVWYANGTHLEKDVNRATELFALAAEAKIKEALYDLAHSKETGKGCPVDLEAAFHLYLDSAIRGDDQAINEVGRCYFFGIGVAEDRTLANIWYDRAEELGVYEEGEDDQDEDEVDQQ